MCCTDKVKEHARLKRKEKYVLAVAYI